MTPEEAKKNESNKPDGTKTWIFKADQVRDFAFCSSRKFIWDAMQHNMGDFPVMAMSFYPNEGEPLVEQVFDARDHSHAGGLFAIHV